jgi:hypothetical protein
MKPRNSLATALVAATITTGFTGCAYAEPQTNYFDETITPDTSDLFGVFARFDPNDCRPASDNPPPFSDLEIVNPPDQGELSDFGVAYITFDELDCKVLARVIFYHAKADFKGSDVISIRDPRTGHTVQVTYTRNEADIFMDLSQFERPETDPDAESDDAGVQ